MALLPGVVHLGRHERDPAKHPQRAGPRHAARAEASLIEIRPFGAPAPGAWQDHLVEFEAIRYETDGAVATITLNRPDVANAQNSQMLDELDRALDLADGDDAVRVLVLAGEGKHFSAGHDLKEILEGTTE